jgi:biotin carboxylase
MNKNIVTTRTLHSVQDIKQYLANRAQPVYFVSPSNFNMMDMHQWVSGWKNINLLDCFDGTHANVLVVPDDHTRVFNSTEDINHYLLSSPLTRELVQSPNDNSARAQAIFLFFDDVLVDVCEKVLDLEVALPPHTLVREVDSKLVTTEIGNHAGVGSVPNRLARVESFAQLQQLAKDAGLGDRWVVQSAYGDSGKTTFFIATEEDYAAVADQIESQSQVKIMRWVRCTGTAIEACATRWGTFVGPLLTELIGARELTPYAGGWCGNELYEAAFSERLRTQVLEKTQAMGDALYERGYRGYFELDFLIDQDSGEVYLGELNSRISGVTAITNMSAFSQTHIPLFLFPA